jgi:hypothetical protein
MHPRAATSIGANYSYTYDNNGNMLTRKEGAVTYTLTWNAKNQGKSRAAEANNKKRDGATPSLSMR